MSAALRLVDDPFPDDDARWEAARARDPAALGAFLIWVATTGVYCLPICAGRPLRRNVSFAPTRLEAERQGYRPCKRCRPERRVAGPLAARIADLDWPGAKSALDGAGFARLGALLSAGECAALIEMYTEDRLYRSTVAMARCGFGAGEYRYFADPLPDPVLALRELLYQRLAPIASEWAARLGEDRAFPARHADYRRRCAEAGQARPAPLILKYGPGDYNRLHQDLYGGEYFPIQAAVLLSEPGKDFEGGEFVLAEQSPRMQPRASVVSLRRGEAVLFAVRERPADGARRARRAKLRHGVSTVTAGARYCLGVIFHDAA